MFARDGLFDATDSEAEVRERGIAWERVCALLRVELGTRNFGVVGSRDGGIDVDEGGAGI